jgi:hypothetical protein
MVSQLVIFYRHQLAAGALRPTKASKRRPRPARKETNDRRSSLDVMLVQVCHLNYFEMTKHEHKDISKKK